MSAPVQWRKPIAHSIEKSLSGAIFLLASHVRPNFDLNRRPGRSDAPPGSQGDMSALLSSLCPNIRLALQAINASLLCPPLSSSAPLGLSPVRFHRPLQHPSVGCWRKSQVILKNGPSASAAVSRGCAHAGKFLRPYIHAMRYERHYRWVGRSIASGSG